MFVENLITASIVGILGIRRNGVIFEFEEGEWQDLSEQRSEKRRFCSRSPRVREDFQKNDVTRGSR